MRCRRHSSGTRPTRPPRRPERAPGSVAPLGPAGSRRRGRNHVDLYGGIALTARHSADPGPGYARSAVDHRLASAGAARPAPSRTRDLGVRSGGDDRRRNIGYADGEPPVTPLRDPPDSYRYLGIAASVAYPRIRRPPCVSISTAVHRSRPSPAAPSTPAGRPHRRGRQPARGIRDARERTHRRGDPDPARRSRPAPVLRGACPPLRRAWDRRAGDRLLRPHGRDGAPSGHVRVPAARRPDPVAGARGRHPGRHRRPSVDRRRPAQTLFSIGFCFGGRMAYLSATLGLGFAGVIGFYGWPAGVHYTGSPAPVEVADRDPRERPWAVRRGRPGNLRRRRWMRFDGALAAAGSRPPAGHLPRRAAQLLRPEGRRVRGGERRGVGRGTRVHPSADRAAGLLRSARPPARRRCAARRRRPGPGRSVSARAGREGRLDLRDRGRRVGEGEDRGAGPRQAGPERAGRARPPRPWPGAADRRPRDTARGAGRRSAGGAGRSGPWRARPRRCATAPRLATASASGTLAGSAARIAPVDEAQVGDEEDGAQVARSVEPDRLDAVRRRRRDHEPAEQRRRGVVRVALDLGGEPEQLRRSTAARRPGHCRPAARRPWRPPTSRARGPAGSRCASRSASRALRQLAASLAQGRLQAAHEAVLAVLGQLVAPLAVDRRARSRRGSRPGTSSSIRLSIARATPEAVVAGAEVGRRGRHLDGQRASVELGQPVRSHEQPPTSRARRRRRRRVASASMNGGRPGVPPSSGP